MPLQALIWLPVHCHTSHNHVYQDTARKATFEQLTMLHHHGQKTHDDLRARPDQNLAFPTLLCIVDAFQRVRENVHAHHDALERNIYKFSVLRNDGQY